MTRPATFFVAVVFGVSLLAASAMADIVLWPVADEAWHPITVGGSPLTDPLGDVSPSWTDVVGSDTYAAGYWYLADGGTPDKGDDELLFRMRLDDYKANPQVVWQFLLDTDADGDIDWSLQVDLSGSEQVELVEATVGGPTFGDLDFSATPAWMNATAGYTRFTDTATGDGSDLGGDGYDVFLDVGISWADFATATGMEMGDPFAIAIATSTSHSGSNKDIPMDGGGDTPVVQYDDQVGAEYGGQPVRDDQ